MLHDFREGARKSDAILKQYLSYAEQDSGKVSTVGSLYLILKKFSYYFSDMSVAVSAGSTT